MSIATACEHTAAVISRARSLFGDVSGAALRADCGSSALHLAARDASAAMVPMIVLSGHAVDAHQSLTHRAAQALSASGHTDTVLAAQLDAARGLTDTGVARLDDVAAQNRAITMFAATAKSPAAQRAVLTWLRAQIAQTQRIVDSTQEHAARLAATTQALSYTHGVGPEPDDTMVGDAGNARQRNIQLVDDRIPLPQDPPPAPAPPTSPSTGEPIKLPPAPPPPVTVIDASPPDPPPNQPGFPKCPTSDNVKHIAEMLLGIGIFGISIPAEVASVGVATPGLLSGGYMAYDGFDELRKCT